MAKENKNGLEFRTLRADEIECRIGTVTEKGLSLLLYKDARVDMTLLDETVGPMNWQREHYNANANCVLSIWDDKKASWVKKDDVGTPSNTEAEKGLASDSFKRAATNWGIGRELYTAPFIWIPADKCNIQDKKCRDFFRLVDVNYDDARNISGIKIINEKTGEVVFNTIDKGAAKSAAPKKEDKPETVKKPAPEKAQNKATAENKPAENKTAAKPAANEGNTANVDPNRPLNEAEINVILMKAAEKHLNIEVICKAYGITTLKQMPVAQFPGCIKKLDATKDQAQKKEASA